MVICGYQNGPAIVTDRKNVEFSSLSRFGGPWKVPKWLDRLLGRCELKCRSCDGALALVLLLETPEKNFNGRRFVVMGFCSHKIAGTRQCSAPWRVYRLLKVPKPRVENDSTFTLSPVLSGAHALNSAFSTMFNASCEFTEAKLFEPKEVDIKPAVCLLPQDDEWSIVESQQIEQGARFEALGVRLEAKEDNLNLNDPETTHAMALYKKYCDQKEEFEIVAGGEDFGSEGEETTVCDDVDDDDDDFVEEVMLSDPNRLFIYDFGGDPVVHQAPHSIISAEGVEVPKLSMASLENCSLCGAPRCFELQLLPSSFRNLCQPDLGGTLLWSSVLVYSCSASCWPEDVYAVEEESILCDWPHQRDDIPLDRLKQIFGSGISSCSELTSTQ